jgi:hypothetical protein
MNAVLLVGIFVLPRILSPRYRPGAKLLAIAAGGAVFIYATYEGAICLIFTQRVLGMGTDTARERPASNRDAVVPDSYAIRVDDRGVDVW